MEAAIMADPKVMALCKAVGENHQEMARVFINAFDDKESKFPFDFDRVWTFLGYSTKASALRKLKSDQFMENEDYLFNKGHINRDVVSGQVTGKEPDKYFMSKNAFEHFAMSSPGEMGRKVRQFFIAIRDAYVSQPPPTTGREASRVDAWDQARCDGIAMFGQKSAGMKRYLEGRRASKDVGWAFYGQVATLLNQAILGFDESTKDFKAGRGIPRSLTIPDMLDGYGQPARGHFELAFENYFNRPSAQLALMDPPSVLLDLTRMRESMRAYLRGVRMDDIEKRLMDVPEAKRRKKGYGEMRKSNAIGPSPITMRVIEGIRVQEERSLE
jgi:phage anti-repressor protein